MTPSAPVEITPARKIMRPTVLAGIYTLTYTLRCIPERRRFAMISLHRTHPYVNALFLTAALTASGFIAAAACPQGTRGRLQNNSQDQPEMRAFKGKILSQNVNGTF